MAREKALAAAEEASELLTLLLLSAYTDGVDEAGARFSSWAMSAASDAPERRWGALQACTTFARGILIDAGEIPEEVVAEIARDKNVADAIEDPMEEAGVHDALEMLGAPGKAEADLDERWWSYASDDCPPGQYVAALIFMFFLAVAAAPAAAARLSQ